MAWDRLIKFKTPKGSVEYGEPIIDHSDELLQKLSAKSLTARVLAGASIPDLVQTGAIAEVAELVGPLTPADVPIVKCIGLNYTKHSAHFSR